MLRRAQSLMDAFGQSIQPWHDFYTLMGSSAAALLGLLFVSVSIHLDALSGDAQSLAYETFNQFFLLLLLAGTCLVPSLTPPTFALALLLLGMLAVSGRAHRRLRYRGLGYRHPWRRDVFPTLAYVILLGTSGVVWVTGAPQMGLLVAVCLMLISQATLNAWEMLVYLGARTQTSASTSR
jgi:hypothetical protein